MGLPEGFHAFEGQEIPFQPNDVLVGKYALLSTFGRMEREEVAARYIIACQEVRVWAGVELTRLFDQAQEEWKEWATSQRLQAEAWEANEEAWIRYRKANALWSLRVLATLGLYAFFEKKPEPPQFRKVNTEPRVLSGVFMVGPVFLEIGLKELTEKGHMVIEYREGIPVLFPTATFFDPIKKHVRITQSETPVVN